MTTKGRGPAAPRAAPAPAAAGASAGAGAGKKEKQSTVGRLHVPLGEDGAGERTAGPGLVLVRTELRRTELGPAGTCCLTRL